jgi:ribosomal protein L29
MSEEKKSLLEDIKLKKRSLLVMKLKLASGETISIKDIRNIKKEVARLFTKLNAIKI